MAYYTTIRDPDKPSQVVFAAGPFNRLGSAAAQVDKVRRLVRDMNFREGPWASYGTARVKTAPLPKGRFNAKLGLPTEGRIP